MPDTTVRRLEGDELLEVMYGLNSYSLHASPPLTNQEEWNQIVRPRQGVTYCALFEDGVPASGVASTAMIQNVRGKLFDAGGVWGVATAPAARRHGYCRQTLAAVLAAGREAGQVFSNLYPFRESFYERLGYVTFPLPRIARLAPSALAPLLGRDLGGRVEVALIGAVYDAYRDYLSRMRPRTHGMGFFVHPDYASANRNRFWLARAMVGGQTVGLMLYDLKGEEETKFLFRAVRFYYDTAQGCYLLLQWIARHVDQADRVELWLAAAEQPETWLADLGIKSEPEIRAPMGRVVDVARLGGMQVGPGGFTARVSDPLCPWNEGVWRFASAPRAAGDTGGDEDRCVTGVEPSGGLVRAYEKPAEASTPGWTVIFGSANGRLRVARATADERPDCDLTIQGLTGLVFGTHDPGDFAIRGWGDPAPDVQGAMRAIFPPMIPHLHERF